ncbi:hypothetical protein, variant 10 [Aphanomyces invadans]|uniref:Uncharacterized protein n=1 Tax=Aphanomyces invadans TaxID=157072 RepID=A0A024TGL0_9STRA|nr:hypothetical protein H310_13330 [Aphanomyces invadans]XP_008879007.1 hypothetical protein, variant 2 [Aphanomyces invadans]XP_008879008.1 hypothetical protein, variant 3 [Aphanomyces invadans]XP_008879009.1 hypothetical protein, variant 6 [Aphanomyces invadans]XP_008879010.1 hypothetical protein, variant 7 [Aphanomyces invadans]XP_008879011.1 hypothetical protein, variant 8 [Aphanomyces invadans]XP_008879012.1 hypothetical protein, variant 9 [Aphanomyces invadans]XP_008879013.1 hypothetic|eukprot:XP_008879006.1 hypothetical protein H310_13330 [Aphanomyces invadans]
MALEHIYFRWLFEDPVGDDQGANVDAALAVAKRDGAFGVATERAGTNTRVIGIPSMTNTSLLGQHDHCDDDCSVAVLKIIQVLFRPCHVGRRPRVDDDLRRSFDCVETETGGTWTGGTHTETGGTHAQTGGTQFIIGGTDAEVGGTHPSKQENKVIRSSTARFVCLRGRWWDRRWISAQLGTALSFPMSWFVAMVAVAFSSLSTATTSTTTTSATTLAARVVNSTQCSYIAHISAWRLDRSVGESSFIFSLQK